MTNHHRLVNVSLAFLGTAVTAVHVLKGWEALVRWQASHRRFPSG